MHSALSPACIPSPPCPHIHSALHASPPLPPHPLSPACSCIQMRYGAIGRTINLPFHPCAANTYPDALRLHRMVGLRSARLRLCFRAKVSRPVSLDNGLDMAEEVRRRPLVNPELSILNGSPQILPRSAGQDVPAADFPNLPFP